MPKLRITSMDSMQSFGKKGEEIAADFLIGKDYQIIERNFRFKKSEIDIICSRNELLIFVEVKARSTKSFGEPETFVSENQKQSVIRAAEQYIIERDWKGDIRFDIIAVYKDKERQEISHFEDAFY
jgi:putative endonuclease